MDEHKPRHLKGLSRFVRNYSNRYQGHVGNELSSLGRSNDWTSELERVWGDQSWKYAHIEHLFHEVEQLRIQLPDLALTTDDLERQERWECLMKELSDELESVVRFEQRSFVMQNLAFELYRRS